MAYTRTLTIRMDTTTIVVRHKDIRTVTINKKSQIFLVKLYRGVFFP